MVAEKVSARGLDLRRAAAAKRLVRFASCPTIRSCSLPKVASPACPCRSDPRHGD